MSSLPTGSTLLVVQGAMFEVLTGYAPLVSIVKGIFDKVPDGQSYPYVELGEAFDVPWNTLTRLGRAAECTVHVWSQGNGFKEALTITDLIIKALDNCRLPMINGIECWRCQWYRTTTMIDVDGYTRHVPIEFEVGTQFAEV